MNEYMPRLIDATIRRKLKARGAILIEGPKWCGKTTTAKQIANSVLYMTQSGNIQSNMLAAEINPSLLLAGPVPRLIDEWQIAPTLWDAIRFEVDQRGECGQFILTGSAVPHDADKIFHTGTDRIGRVKMRGMSLYESGDSSGEISLQSLFGASDFFCSNRLDINRLAFLICRGGWPLSINKDDTTALDQALEYYDEIINADISRVDRITRNPGRAKSIMHSYARHQGTQTSYKTLRDDIISNDTNSVTEDTIYSYTNALRKIFVIEDVSAWSPNLRSKSAIRTTDTRYFTDPSIAAASLYSGPSELLNDLNTMGLLFETLCIRDLKIYAESIDGDLFHYRDKSGLECDAVIHLRNGSYGLVEIKLGGEQNIEDGAKNLLRFKEKIDTSRMKEPSFLMVLIGVGKFGYKRKDGVYVVPIGCLKN